MEPPTAVWRLKPQPVPPSWCVDLLRSKLNNGSGQFAARLLWQRGIQDRQAIIHFLEIDQYQPTGAEAFGEEMQWAIARLKQARERQERVFIWGDFDADGITATAVLWEGLGQFFVPDQTLHFTIPNRLQASHGLSREGLAAIAAQGAQLVVTCDTGSSDQAEIEYARSLGIDVIVTDHHTLPEARPPVVAFLNPRTLAADHPLAHLSGVAVAYKLVEALYSALSDVPHQPLENLLDLVAIGLIADLVELKGDCRYLAQRGLLRLKGQQNSRTRPGVAKLLELCKKNGDRPTDISFGLGPRINALSRIQGDARAGVALLTVRDPIQGAELAESAEWINLCRKEVQQRITQEAEAQLAQVDIESAAVLVLSDPQWPVGVLGLVAGQLAQTYGRPTILLGAAQQDEVGTQILRGSARSVQGIDLYNLLQQQAHLLSRFGGHPLAAGLSLPISNLSLFTASINQAFRQTYGQLPAPVLDIDLELTLADIVPYEGSALFRELLLLEPYGMGNPKPRLLLRNCWFTKRRSSQYQTVANRKLKFKKTQFWLRDDSTPETFEGLWWGHDAEELPEGRCDIVVELDFGRLYKDQDLVYHLRLVALRLTLSTDLIQTAAAEPWLLDWRSHSSETLKQLPCESQADILVLPHCPRNWAELETWTQQAQQQNRKLALAYPASTDSTPVVQWQHLVGLAKYLARTQQTVEIQRLQQQLHLSRRALEFGLEALATAGFGVIAQEDAVSVRATPDVPPAQDSVASEAIRQFTNAVSEECFLQDYFQLASTTQLQKTLERRLGFSNNGLALDGTDSGFAIAPDANSYP
ncbi:MAG TPA: single-stranded-DNA-specific exonuclease RecJ [Stenomitos sp.]